jgi:hypothetical protein
MDDREQQDCWELTDRKSGGVAFGGQESLNASAGAQEERFGELSVERGHGHGGVVDLVCVHLSSLDAGAFYDLRAGVLDWKNPGRGGENERGGLRAEAVVFSDEVVSGWRQRKEWVRRRMD